jgi:hypothetical protein
MHFGTGNAQGYAFPHVHNGVNALWNRLAVHACRIYMQLCPTRIHPIPPLTSTAGGGLFRVGKEYTHWAGKSPFAPVLSHWPKHQPDCITSSPVSFSSVIKSPLRKLRNADPSPVRRVWMIQTSRRVKLSLMGLVSYSYLGSDSPSWPQRTSTSSADPPGSHSPGPECPLRWWRWRYTHHPEWSNQNNLMQFPYRPSYETMQSSAKPVVSKSYETSHLRSEKSKCDYCSSCWRLVS